MMVFPKVVYVDTFKSGFKETGNTKEDLRKFIELFIVSAYYERSKETIVINDPRIFSISTLVFLLLHEFIHHIAHKLKLKCLDRLIDSYLK